jgi:hypothetical protein
MLATFTARTNDQPEVPEYVRQAGVVDGVRVYFVVFPIFRHGPFGAVVGYQMMVSANDTGMDYVPGNYLSVVPDGVRRVRWHFTCSHDPAGSGCQVPDTTVSVPVRDNLAVLPITNAVGYPTVNAATWYRRDGSHTTFINQNRAVPFQGAPAWPR